MNNYWYHVNCFRLDWLENVGYDIDDLTEVKISYEPLSRASEGVMFLSNHVFSYEEFCDILRAFTEEDPDGNGIDDTFGAMYPLTGPSYGSHWTDIYTACSESLRTTPLGCITMKPPKYVPPYASTDGEISWFSLTTCCQKVT